MLRGITLGQLGNTIGNRVHGMLEDLYGELLAAASRVDPDKPPSWKHARLEVLQRKVQALIKGTYGTILRDVTSDMTTLAGSESEWVRSLVNKAAGDELMDVALHQRDLKVLATDTMIQGAPSAQWWGQQASATEDAFMREIRNGVLRGESIDDMARRVRGKPTGKRFSWYTKKGEHRWNVEFEGGLLQTNTRNAKALARTSVMAVAGQARRETYLANRDVIKGIEQISTLDTRTTPICMAYDGEQWYFEDPDNEQSLTQAAREAHGGRSLAEEIAGSLKQWWKNATQATEEAMEANYGEFNAAAEDWTEFPEMESLNYYVNEDGYKQINQFLRDPAGFEEDLRAGFDVDKWEGVIAENTARIEAGGLSESEIEDLSFEIEVAEGNIQSFHDKMSDARMGAADISNLMRKAPSLDEDHIFYRAQSARSLNWKWFKRSDVEGTIARGQDAIGTVITDPAFLSTTANPEWLKKSAFM